MPLGGRSWPPHMPAPHMRMQTRMALCVRRAYIAIGANQVDLLIVAISVLIKLLESSSLSFLEALRVLRAIKPLRALTRSAGMRLVFRWATNKTVMSPAGWHAGTSMRRAQKLRALGCQLTPPLPSPARAGR